MCLIYKNSVGDPPCHTPAESKQTWARNDLNLEDSEKSLEDFSPLPWPKHTHFNQDDILDNSTPCIFQSHGIRVRVEVEHQQHWRWLRTTGSLPGELQHIRAINTATLWKFGKATNTHQWDTITAKKLQLESKPHPERGLEHVHFASNWMIHQKYINRIPRRDKL